MSLNETTNNYFDLIYKLIILDFFNYIRYYFYMTTNSKPSLLSNLDHLKKMIIQSPEDIVELLVQKELSNLFSLNFKEQDKILNLELEKRTSVLERDFHQFYLNRKSLWEDLIAKDTEKAFLMIKPIIELEVNNSLNTELFILTETKH